jgi:hypothetical protein
MSKSPFGLLRAVRDWRRRRIQRRIDDIAEGRRTPQGPHGYASDNIAVPPQIDRNLPFGGG